MVGAAEATVAPVGFVEAWLGSSVGVLVSVVAAFVGAVVVSTESFSHKKRSGMSLIWVFAKSSSQTVYDVKRGRLVYTRLYEG